jgi:hypothetical protein
LVLIAHAAELIEEGAGFGVPIAKYTDKTYFSTNAEVYVKRITEENVVLTKVFFLDAVSKKQVRGANINDSFYTVFHRAFEKAYLNRPFLRPVFDWTMKVRNELGVTTQFIRLSPKGEVVVTYDCFPNTVKVNVDLSGVEKASCREILILNEQGAEVFRRYSDSEGVVLYDRQIGGWAKVTAKNAAFSDTGRCVSFSVENEEAASLYRGWERVKDRFSWAGVTFGLSPVTSSFNYKINIRNGA